MRRQLLVTVLLAVVAVALVELAVVLLLRTFVPDDALPDPVELMKASQRTRHPARR
jgi:hypothetical protein